MADEIGDAEAPEMPEVPEELEEKVVAAVLTRLRTPQVADLYGIQNGTPRNATTVTTIPFFALSTQQVPTVEQIWNLRNPSGWGFHMKVEVAEGSAAPTVDVLAAAGPAAAGGFEYSRLIDIPLDILESEQLSALLREMEGQIWLAYLEVPSCYIEAFWIRTAEPSTDFLFFFNEHFNRFPENFQVPLTELVKYLSDALAKGDPLRSQSPEDTAE